MYEQTQKLFSITQLISEETPAFLDVWKFLGKSETQ